MRKIAAVITGMFIVANIFSQKDVSGTYKLALELAAEKDYAQAITKLDWVIQHEPKNTHAIFNRALIKFKSDNLTGAFIDMEILESLDPHYPRLNYVKGTIMLQLGELSQAEACFAKELISSPRDFESLYMEGLVLALEEDWECALGKLEEAAALNPAYAKAFHEIGSIYWNLGETDSALVYYKKASALKPFDGQYAGNLGLSYLANWDPQPALDYLEKARDMDSATYVQSVNSGVAYYMVEDYTLASQYLEKAIEIEPSNPVAWINLGVVLIKTEAWSDAQKILSRAVELSAQDAYAWLNLGIAYDQDMQFEKACECFRKAEQYGAEKADKYVRNQCREIKP